MRPLEAGGRLVREHGVGDPFKGSREAEEEEEDFKSQQFNDSHDFQRAKTSD